MSVERAINAPKLKRQKVAVACDPCRSRKVKCDGREPVCQPCSRRAGGAVACTWDSSTSVRADLPADHVQLLYDRIRLLEQRQHGQLANHRHQPERTVGNGTAHLLDSAVDRGCSTSFFGSPTLDSTISAQCDQDLPLKRHQIDPPSQLKVDNGDDLCRRNAPQQDSSGGEVGSTPANCQSVHAIIGATQDEDYREGFFGSTSAGTFMQSVRRIVEQKFTDVSLGTMPTTGDRDHLPLLIPDRRSKRKEIEYVLPSRRKADRLMDLYWRYVHVLYPYLDKEQTQNDYEKIWHGRDDDSGSDEQSFLCLLYIIFALTSQIDMQIAFQDRGRVAAMYYERAYGLMDIRETGSIRAVQSFLLLGQYFQSTNEPHSCWVFVGLAVRIAQSLGLHQARTSQRAPDVRTREILRRVWHGCILMDRVLSMTYGRPCSIGPRTRISVPLPQPMDHEYVPGEVAQSATTRGAMGRPSFVDFYILSLKLYDILNEVLFNYYTSETPDGPLPKDTSCDAYFGRSSTGKDPAFFELERKLSHWEASIPEHLRSCNRPAGAVGAEALLYRQAVILRQRHIYVRLLLLRPILSAFITSEWHSAQQVSMLGGVLARRILLQCAVACVDVAHAAIDVVYMEEEALGESPYYLSAWWYNVLFLYASATVLIAARLSPDILNEIPDTKIQDSWSKAIELLERYGSLCPSIQRLVATLRLLSDAVPQQYSRLRQQKPVWHSDDGMPASMILAKPQAVPVMSAFSTPGDVARISLQSPGQEGTVDVLSPAAEPFDETLLPGSFLGFDNVFDPNDLSWLLTVPFNS